jgi:ABC-2 type transport system permease protein
VYTLPFISTAFVPTASMTPILAWFAEYQPFSPIIDTLRTLFANGDVGSRGLVAVGWCIALALVGYLWARAAYNRSTTA